MEVRIRYPHVVSFTVDMEIPDDTVITGLIDEDIVEILKANDEQLAGF